jgi:hypothetical protein
MARELEKQREYIRTGFTDEVNQSVEPGTEMYEGWMQSIANSEGYLGAVLERVVIPNRLYVD